MLEFIPAATLKKSFDVFGHFYSVNLVSGIRIECRSVLEIVRKEKEHANLNLLPAQAPDAIFIMMNPGSSKPSEEVENIISERDISQLSISLVPTKPDTTQYQLMRVMHYCKWSHVRVLNISDLRDPKSGNFVDRYRVIEKETGYTAHSLFDDKRNNEFKMKIIKKKLAPVICAWGVSTNLDTLITKCTNKISGTYRLTGLLKPNTLNKYFHPLPTLQTEKIKWVDDIVKRIKADQLNLRRK